MGATSHNRRACALVGRRRCYQRGKKRAAHAAIFVRAGAAIAAFVIGASAAAGPGTSESGEWRLIGLNAEQQHFSPLKQIDDKNVQTLGLAWVAEIPSADGLVGVPLVAEGIVYQSGPPGRVYANDVRTGQLLWTYDAKIPPQSNIVSAWGSRVNRGLALWEDKVFIGTGDCRLIAIDAKRGSKIWDVQSCDPADSYTITGAPRVGAGKVFIGNANGDTGANRGYVDAFEASTGRHIWRFYTIPGDPAKGFESPIMEMASKTWGREYWKKAGGGSAWDAMTYDPTLNLLYIGTDGATPIDPRQRGEGSGDELFTTSIIAVNADTGEYVWHYQTTPHDAWNYDATMHIMIAELTIGGVRRRVVMEAPKNGFFYVLDARTGKLISARNIVPINWASRIDMKTGRPVELAAGRWYEHPEGAIVAPGGIGAHSWQPMSYSPLTGLVYIPAMNNRMRSVSDTRNKVGNVDADFYTDLHSPRHFTRSLIAWDPVNQRAKWQHVVGLPQNGGVLSTAGNLVFQGTSDGELHAYQADTGKRLWTWQSDSGVYAAPSTVEIDGVQLILVPTGSGTASASHVFPRYGAKTMGPSRLLAFKLGGTATLPTSTAIAEQFPRPALPREAADVIAKGRAIWAASGCEFCHGYDAIGAQGGSIPDLRKSAAVTSELFDRIVLDGQFREMGMPSFKELITPEDLPALRAFIVNQAWSAYETQSTQRPTH